MGRHGQIGIEFFLVLGFSFSIIGLLIMNSERQLAQNDELEAAVVSLSAMNTVSNGINTAYLQGSGASMRMQVFLPKAAKCFLVDSASRALTCDIGDADGRKVYAMQLLSIPTDISTPCYTSVGWLDVNVKNVGTPDIRVSCVPLA